MEKPAKKTSIHCAPNVADEFARIRAEFSADAKRELTMTEVLQAMLRISRKCRDQASFHESWSLDRLVSRLRVTDPDFVKRPFLADHSKAVISLIEEKTKETEAALAGESGGFEVARRLRRGRKKKTQGLEEDSSSPNEAKSDPPELPHVLTPSGRGTSG